MITPLAGGVTPVLRRTQSCNLTSSPCRRKSSVESTVEGFPIRMLGHIGKQLVEALVIDLLRLFTAAASERQQSVIYLSLQIYNRGY